MQIRHICVLITLLCFCQPAGAQEADRKFDTKNDQERAQATTFMEVYFHYMDTMNTRGIAGLKPLTTSDFTFKWDKEALTGEKAFIELKKQMPDPSDLKESEQINAVKMRRLVIVGDQAFVQIEETHSLHLKEQPENASASKMTNITASWKMLFKQTWRKTTQGWRLALWEKGTKKLSGYVSAITYTVNWHLTKPDASPVTDKILDKK